MRYVFQRDLVAPNAKGVNQPFAAGDEIDGKDILPGALASCLQNRSLAEATKKPKAEPAKAEPAK